MSRSSRRWISAAAGAAALAATVGALAAAYPGVGRLATPAEIRAWDIDVRPDFQGLPPGSGSVARGQEVWEAKCASCHGYFGESNEVYAPLIGGTTPEDVKTGRVKALAAGEQRTTMMKLSTISTLWDYINRAMPWNAPKTLSTEEVYAVVAYMLHLESLVPADFTLSERNIAEVQKRLPNRNGMTLAHGLWDVRGKPDVKNVACMKDCVTGTPTLASALPEYARDHHGNLAEQHRLVGPARGTQTVRAATPEKLAANEATKSDAARPAPAAGSAAVADLAKRKACLSCHGVDRKIVGPAFKEVAERYKGQDGAAAKLAERMRRGSTGVWGPIPMPPNPDLAEADAAELARWILGGAG